MVKREKATEREKKSRAKYPCPPGLLEIIERVNRLIPHMKQGKRETKIGYSESSPYYQAAVNQIADFAAFVENHNFVLQKAFDNYYKEFGYDAVRDIDLIVEDLMSTIAIGYWADMEISLDEASSFMVDWLAAFVDRNGIKALKNRKTAWITVEEDKENLLNIIESCASTKKRKQKIDLNLVQVQSQIVIQDNKINVILPELFRVLDGQDIDRLRICANCERIFWAKRKDSETCSLQCANNLRVKRYRDSAQTKLKKLLKELTNEKKNLEKLTLNLNQKNSLISQQKSRVNKLVEKIKEEKDKNGTI